MPVVMKNGVMDAPTPGQSLTSPPGKYPFEQPPKLVDPEEACDFVWDRLTNDERLPELLAIMEAQMPLSDIARVIVMEGVSSGTFTLDVAVLIYDVVAIQLVGLAHAAKIKYTLEPKGRKPSEKSLLKLLNSQRMIKKNNITKRQILDASDFAEKVGAETNVTSDTPSPEAEAALGGQAEEEPKAKPEPTIGLLEE